MPAELIEEWDAYLDMERNAFEQLRRTAERK